MTNDINPVKPKERHIILDALRGIALFGICLANYPEFSLYTFLNNETVAAMSTAGIDIIVKYLQYIFIDGKFYTLFSILFGIGFSIILSNFSQSNSSGLKIFYRRMFILFIIGLLHLLLLWAGDILILYAFLGFFLPLFRNISNKKLLAYSVVLLLFPIVMDTCTVAFGWNLSAPVIKATQYFHNRAGITEDNFAVWLVESKNYPDVLRFNLAGSFIRMQEFIEGNRAFKVFGLFLIGLYIGKNKIYSNLEANRTLLKKITFFGFITGFPVSLLYAWSAMNSHPLGLITHSLIYAVSVVPLSLAYISAVCLWYIKSKNRTVFKIFAAPGRMALTNYIMQSVIGIVIFYGVGFSLGAATGLIRVELIAFFVFGFQILYSHLWLFYNKFGPLEWIWRMLTYGKWLKITKF